MLLCHRTCLWGSGLVHPLLFSASLPVQTGHLPTLLTTLRTSCHFAFLLYLPFFGHPAPSSSIIFGGQTPQSQDFYIHWCDYFLGATEISFLYNWKRSLLLPCLFFCPVASLQFSTLFAWAVSENNIFVVGLHFLAQALEHKRTPVIAKHWCLEAELLKWESVGYMESCVASFSPLPTYQMKITPSL